MLTLNNPSLKEFFLSRTEKTEIGCWFWRGRITGRGYGTIKMGEKGREVLAHRASWIIHHGEIPKGHVVCHKCDNPICVRPDHLFVGTQKENIKDAISKGRYWQRGKFLPKHGEKTHCPHGHPYDEKNTGHSLIGNSIHRYCRTCHRDRARERRRLIKC